jgi:hypothetical protein
VAVSQVPEAEKAEGTEEGPLNKRRVFSARHSVRISMLSNSLVTNEVKNSAGVEIEFTRMSTNDRQTVFAKVNEVPSLPHRLILSHQESGSGIKLVRRSVMRFDKTIISEVDAITPVVISCYTVAVIPVGHLDTLAEPTHVVANNMSFLASLGANSTILYDGTGNGAVVLLYGTL